MVKLDDYEMKLLAELVDTRRANKSLVKTRKDIVSEMIRTAHKKECNN
jgi:hypothetical protein